MAKVEFIGFDYMSAGTVAEIRRNITALIETPEGTCAGDRSYGIPQEFVGMPIDVARNLSALAVIEKLELYEPRATLLEVKTEADTQTGRIVNTFYIGPNESYEEEAAEEDIEEDEEVS